MKKNILTIAFTLSLSMNLFADLGRINFFNSAATHVTLYHQVQGNLGPMPATLGEFKFELFIAPARTSNPFLFVTTGLIGTNRASPGRFNGGANLEVPGVQAGEIRSILIRGWSTSLGNDYATAKANWDPFFTSGYLGESAIAPNYIFGGFDGTGPLPTSPAFGGAFGIQSGFALVGVPEPTTGALIGLGVATVFLSGRRSRKQQGNQPMMD